MRPLELELVEQHERVRGKIHRRGIVGQRPTATDAAMVVEDELEVALELAQERLAPVAHVSAHALDEQERLSDAAALVVQLTSRDRQPRHRRNATDAPCC